MTTQKIMVPDSEKYVLVLSTDENSVEVQPATCIGIVQTDHPEDIVLADYEGSETPMIVIDNTPDSGLASISAAVARGEVQIRE